METQISNQNTLTLLRQRCEKISAAMLLVADLFDQDHPIRGAFTKNAIVLLDYVVVEKGKANESLEKVSLILQKLSSLLVSAHDARLVSTMNYDLLIGELEATIVLSRSQVRSREFVSSSDRVEEKIQTLATRLHSLGTDISQDEPSSDATKKSSVKTAVHPEKNKPATETAHSAKKITPTDEGPLYRAQRIMTIIRENRGAATMNDIVLQIPGVSTKTLQRDLSGLMDTHQLARIGARRWAKYVISGSPEEKVLLEKENEPKGQDSSFGTSQEGSNSFLVGPKSTLGQSDFSSKY